MLRKTSVLLAAAMAVSFGASAAEFPLKVVDLSVEEVAQLPPIETVVSVADFAWLTLDKPEALLKAPETESDKPVYGTIEAAGGKTMVFRIDQSEKGGDYDRLVLDLNANGDLTDDPVVGRTANSPATDPESLLFPSQLAFGPIVAPESVAQGNWRPRMFAQVQLDANAMTGDAFGDMFFGFLNLVPANCLETTLDLDGVKRRIAILDANSDMRISTEAIFHGVAVGPQLIWDSSRMDMLLCDRDGSGEFENRPAAPEIQPFGSLLAMGSKLYSVSLSDDRSSLRVEPYAGPAGRLTFGEDRSLALVTIGRELAKGEWEALFLYPGEMDGPVPLPPGRVRLHSCILATAAGDNSKIIVKGSNSTVEGVAVIEEGKTTELPCGAPLTLDVKAQTRNLESGGLLGALFGMGPPSHLVISCDVAGAGPEVYSEFTKFGSEGESEPAPPSFTIDDEEGKQIASGSLEYG